MEKIMNINEKQFEALLAAIRDVSDSIDLLSERVAMTAASIVKIGDPEGWAAAQEATDDLFDDDEDE